MAVTAVKKTTLPRQTSLVTVGQLKGSFPFVPPNSAFIFTPCGNLPDGIYIEEFIGKVSGDGAYNIIVENHSLQQVTIPRNTKLGVIEIAQQIIGKVALNTSEIKPIESREPIVISEVDPEFQAPLSQLLNDFHDLFASKDSELGNTNLIKHTIDTEGRGPIRQRPYRVTNNQRKLLEDKVQEMLDAKVIRYSQSPWASPVVLVEKKNGEIRFCVDYRKLNSITKKDSFPMPRIDETLDKLYGKKFFTTLDLASGYWQIQVHDPDIEKTAFVVENNLYEFERMAFGLCNAPATFQRLMNYVLRDVLGNKALVYLDDVIIFSDTFESHLNDIREIFNLLKAANLKLKLNKCQFAKRSVNYLGHVISTDGIKPDPSKIDKIVNYKTPTSVDEVRSFLGLAGYYRRFIKDFGSIAKPLTRLTHKDLSRKPFAWGTEEQVAFEKLRNSLVTPPVLAYPNFNEKFFLFTDACEYGIGAVLSQMQDGQEHPIAYSSRQLTKAETKYSTTEKEALAVVDAIKYFRHYLLDKPFEIISDHRPLQWLKNQKDNNGRLGRWAILLAATNYELKYRPGRIHQNADCLSRLKVASIQPVPNNIKLICEKQLEDELCIDIRNYLEKGVLDEKFSQSKPDWAKEIEYFEIIEGTLYRHELPSKDSKRNEINHQLVLPYSLRHLVLKELHDAPMGGHLAFYKTYLKVKNNYYWPTMRKDILEYCQACEICTANTASTYRALLHPHELAKAPFQVIGMDFLGPITPVSPNGNSCILVITDYFSRWVEAVALKDQTAQTTAECVYKTIIVRHGMPKAIVSDRGTNFTSKLFRYFCKKLKVDQRLTTAYNPASNGETERFNRTLTSMLRKELKDGKHANWEEMLDDVLFAYRSSTHSSTLETPYYLVHGRDPNIPINEFLDASPSTFKSASDYVGNLNDRLRYSFQRVREETEKARNRQREQYNKRAKEKKYVVGDKVLLDIRVVKDGDSRKFTSKYKGPYRVVKVYNNNTVDIADSSYVCQRTHVNRLKPLYETMLWKTEPCPPIENPSDFENRFRKSIATQTQDHGIAMEDQDHEEILASDDYEDDTTQTTDHFEDVNVSQQQADVVSVHRPSSEDNISNTEESDNETQSVRQNAIDENDSARAEVDASESLPSEPEEETPTENPELLHVTRRPQRNRQKPLRYRDGVQ
uniref:RNA-directed DNA polymerase n=2 Tax=Daphnia magna TaxID=35525 RepID=A0A0P4ZJF0_9CRUS